MSVEQAWRNAVAKARTTGELIFHSDRGVKYASVAFKDAITPLGFIPSMSRWGNFWDNAVAEGFFEALKTEEVTDLYNNEAAANVGIAGYIRGFCRGYPAAIRAGQGPEFTGRSLDQWAHSSDVMLILTQPEKPTQNVYIEKFNGKFRDKCLNEHWFTSVDRAKALIATWRGDYNEVRPHGAIGNRIPAEFAETLREYGVLSTNEQKSDMLETRGFAKSLLVVELGAGLRHQKIREEAAQIQHASRAPNIGGNISRDVQRCLLALSVAFPGAGPFCATAHGCRKVDLLHSPRKN